MTGKKMKGKDNKYQLMVDLWGFTRNRGQF